jgi:hypothetical protein
MSTKIYILSGAHISFKVNIFLMQTTRAHQRFNDSPQEAHPTVWEPLLWSLVVIICPNHLNRSRGSSVTIVSDNGLDAWVIEVRSQAETRGFSSNLCVQIGSGAHPACYPVPGVISSGVKRDVDHSPHLVPKSWMSRSYTPLPLRLCRCVVGLFYLLCLTILISNTVF